MITVITSSFWPNAGALSQGPSNIPKQAEAVVELATAAAIEIDPLTVEDAVDPLVES